MLGGIKFNAFFTFLCCCVINMWWRNFRCERLLGMLSEDQRRCERCVWGRNQGSSREK